MSSHEFVTVMVKYAREGGNALPFKCRASDTVFDLARDIKSNASLFDLEDKDIKLNKVEIFTRSADGSKKCLNFNDGIDAYGLKSVEVEFDNHPTEYVSVRVKHKHSVNPTRVQIEATREVCDLVENVLERLDQFSLGETEIQQIASSGSEIRFLRESGEGQYDVLSPVTSIAEVKDEVINFDVVSSTMKLLGNPTTISVTYKGSQGAVKLDCWENDTVETVIDLIRKNVKEFKLSRNVTEDIQNPANEIIIKPLSSDQHRHVRGLTLDQKLKGLKERRLQFYIASPPDLGDLAKLSIGQNIVVFGAVGHGKSSTINTIARAFPGVQDSIAETSSGVAAGTHVVSPHSFTIQGKTFNIVDVPGGGLPAGETQDGRKRLERVIGWIIDGSFPEEMPTDYWDQSYKGVRWLKYAKSTKIGKTDCVVIVHNGRATSVDVITCVASNIAMSRGRGIPVFGIVTHIDKLQNDEEINRTVKELSSIANIAEEDIYPLCNVRHGQKGRDQSEYVLTMLRSMLTRSKRYKTKSSVEVK